jgi:hypothetical protein
MSTSNKIKNIEQDIKLVTHNLTNDLRKKFILTMLNLEKNELMLGFVETNAQNSAKIEQLNKLSRKIRYNLSQLLMNQSGGGIHNDIRQINDNLARIKRQISQLIDENDQTIGLFIDLTNEY